MPDSELFKVIMQGGMFGLWLVFVVWALFRGAPMLQQTIEKLIVAFQQEQSAEREQCRLHHTEQMKEHQVTRHLVNNLATAARLRSYLEKSPDTKE